MKNVSKSHNNKLSFQINPPPLPYTHRLYLDYRVATRQFFTLFSIYQARRQFYEYVTIKKLIVIRLRNYPMYKYDIVYLTSPIFNGEIFEVCNIIAIFVQLIQTGIVMGVVVGVKSKW